MNEDIQIRLDDLIKRLQTAYDGIGHNSGRPYVYFVYPSKQESTLQRMMREQLRNNTHLFFHCLDLLPLTIQCLEGQEERRQELLDKPRTQKSTVDSIVALWKERIYAVIIDALSEAQIDKRPVVVLYGLAALHPLTNPSVLMEYIADKPPRNPHNGTIIPIVVFIPGSRPPLGSRQYYFLDLEPQLDFYRGEEI